MALVGSPIGKPWARKLPVNVGLVGKTYADFQAHIATLATDGSLAWSATMDATSAGSYATTAAGTGGLTLSGSPWGPSASLGNVRKSALSSTARIVQHGLPSEAEFTAQVSNARALFIQLTSAASTTNVAVDRNGYLSLASGSSTNQLQCPQIIYWDGTQAQRMQPSLGLGPDPYTW